MSSVIALTVSYGRYAANPRRVLTCSLTCLALPLSLSLAAILRFSSSLVAQKPMLPPDSPVIHRLEERGRLTPELRRLLGLGEGE